MEEFQISYQDLIPACNAVTVLQTWLRPGYFSLLIGEHVAAMRELAMRLQREIEAMQNEVVKKYPATIEVGDPLLEQTVTDVGSDTPHAMWNVGDPHPQAGQNVIVQLSDGRTLTPYLTSEIGKNYEARQRELMSTKITIRVEERLTREHLKVMLDKERLDTPRMINGVTSVQPVDFAALIPLFKFTDSNISQSPSSNGNRVAELMPTIK